MRVVIFCLAVMAGATLRAQAPPPGSTSGEAAAILSAAREALGGETRQANVRTIVASGRTQQILGNNLVPIEFEISIELPDKYLRTDEIPAKESGPSSRGFNGNLMIVAGDGPARGSGAKPPADPAIAVKQDFARLTLGMFATSFSALPLTFGLAGQAEAPEGRADVLDVKGAGNFSARFFIDSNTHLPLMLSWTTPPNLVPVVAGQKPPANLAPGSVTFETPAPPPASASAEEKRAFEDAALEARKQAMASAGQTEHRIYFADYREVNGLRFPFRLRRAVGATTIEETTFDRYRLNQKIDPRKFEARP